MEDRDIIRKCLSGNPASFGLLVDKYKAGVYATAYSKLGNFKDAEDVTQQVFLTIYRELNTVKRYNDFPMWLYSVTSKLCEGYHSSSSD